MFMYASLPKEILSFIAKWTMQKCYNYFILRSLHYLISQVDGECRMVSCLIWVPCGSLMLVGGFAN